MNRETLETLAMWGDRETRDTAALLDIVIAGTIEHLRGHGTVRLLPARLEEIAHRIEKRQQGADGAWLLTLLPPKDDLVAVNPYDVLAYVHETYTQAAEKDELFDDINIASLVIAASKPGVTLHDLGMQGFAYFVEWVGERYMHSVDNRPG